MQDRLGERIPGRTGDLRRFAAVVVLELFWLSFLGWMALRGG